MNPNTEYLELIVDKVEEARNVIGQQTVFLRYAIRYFEDMYQKKKESLHKLNNLYRTIKTLPQYQLIRTQHIGRK